MTKRITKKLSAEITGAIIGRLYQESFLKLVSEGVSLGLRVYNEHLTTPEDRAYMASEPVPGRSISFCEAR